MVRALHFLRAIPEDVQAVVHNGIVTLTGHVEWPFQKRVTEEAVCHLKGVRRVVNYIVVTGQMDELRSTA